MGGLVADTVPVLAVRYGRRVALPLLLATLALPVAVRSADADFHGTNPTVGCQATSEVLTFGGLCVGIQGPTAPTQPTLSHAWLTSPPSAPVACSPYETTEWAPATAASSGGAVGEVWTAEDQRVPIVISTPLTDWGWIFTVTCGAPGAVRFVRVVSGPRTPSPCTPQTAPGDCLPGLDPSEFLAAVTGQVPAETIEATPSGVGIVGVPVEAQLSPAPEPKYAEIDLAVPDAGDGDPGETLHVVWVVVATPEVVSWKWPDGSLSADGKWIPQTYVESGVMRASLVYTVTATGFWSDGVTVHELSSVSVGTIPIGGQLDYSVEQIQPGLG